MDENAIEKAVLDGVVGKVVSCKKQCTRITSGTPVVTCRVGRAQTQLPEETSARGLDGVPDKQSIIHVRHRSEQRHEARGRLHPNTLQHGGGIVDRGICHVCRLGEGERPGQGLRQSET